MAAAPCVLVLSEQFVQVSSSISTVQFAVMRSIPFARLALAQSTKTVFRTNNQSNISDLALSISSTLMTNLSKVWLIILLFDNIRISHYFCVKVYYVRLWNLKI